MFGLGMGELILIFVIALLVLGPKQLPKLMADLGKAIRDFRRAAEDVKSELTIEDEIRKPFLELHEAMTLSPEELKRREEERKRFEAAAAEGLQSLQSAQGTDSAHALQPPQSPQSPSAQATSQPAEGQTPQTPQSVVPRKLT